VLRLHPLHANTAYVVINTNPPRSRQNKAAPRQGFITKWNTGSWSLEKYKKVGEKGITCIDLSADGRFLAFGSSELSVGMLDATTLAVSNRCVSYFAANMFHLALCCDPQGARIPTDHSEIQSH